MKMSPRAFLRVRKAALPFLAMATTPFSAMEAEAATTEPQATEQPEESEPQAAPAPRVELNRAFIARYYAGFHWGIDLGAAFGNGKAGFGIAPRLEYGFDTGSVIIAPGVNLAAYFFNPNVYIGMPTAKLALPIGWFVPFIEGGAGFGYVTRPTATGLAVLGGGGFMIHASPNVALGVNAGYETILGTDFAVIIVGPLLFLSF